MTEACEILAELTLDTRSPERSGRRLIEWAKTCAASGIVIPKPASLPAGSLGALIDSATAQGLRCYVQVRHSREAKEPVFAAAGGYAVWQADGVDGMTEGLRGCGKPILLMVEDPADARLVQWRGLERVTAVAMNLGKRLRDWFLMKRSLEGFGLRVGYSDQQPEPWRALNSALAHAPMVVKGLTLNRSLGGDEHQGSLYPDEFADLVEFIREHEQQGDTCRASGEFPNEPEVRPPASRIESLAAAKALKKGQLLQPEDLKRVPGLSGLTAEMAGRLIGRELLFDRQPDEPITFGVLEPWPGQSAGEPLDEVAVVIRAKNEGRWLRRSLAALIHQHRPPKQIIVVDNESTDDSVSVAAQFAREWDVRLCAISDREFSFGRALNRGIAATSAPWIVSLSAHCIPVHDRWLEALRVPQRERPFVAGVYGRQEPLPNTTDFDKRDLWTTFGPEPRIQRGQDYFFHNANSLIRRSVWERIPFDESLNGVEDRDWAKKVLADGYQLMYTPLASVHHYHGIHQGRNEARARRVVKVIELIQQRDPVSTSSR